jgi:heterotetrameric sarcosine oxidase delta subunit
MMRIPCPYCGPRNSDEFAYIGEARTRPAPDADPDRWRDYLYTRRNPAGWTTETWFHRHGCRKFLVAERHTVTNEVRSTRLSAGGASS